MPPEHLEQAGNKLNRVKDTFITREPLEEELSRTEENIGKNTKKQQEKRAEKSDLTKEFQGQRKNLEKVKNELTGEKKQEKTLTTEITTKKERLSSVDKQIAAIEGNTGEVPLEETEETLQNLRQEKAALEQQIEVAQVKLEEVKRKIEQLNQEETRINNEITRLESAIGIVEGDLSFFEEEGIKLNETKDQQSAELKKLTTVIDQGQIEAQDRLERQHQIALLEEADKKNDPDNQDPFNNVSIWPMATQLA